MDSSLQLGSARIVGCSFLEDVASTIEKQVGPSLLLQSELLRRQQQTEVDSRIFFTQDDGQRCLCWSISPAMHRVIVRTVLVKHLLLTGSEVAEGTPEKELAMLVKNIQTAILNMQVATAGNVNLIFREKDEVVDVFLEANEEILDGDTLYSLCCNPQHRMNVGALAQAVALRAVPRVHESCMNKEEMLSAMENEDEEDENEIRPSWWPCNEDERVFTSSTDMVPIVRLHPLHEDDNHKLCLECNETVFEDHEMYWSSVLERCEVLPYRGWVEFVVRQQAFEGDDKKQQATWLCLKLLDSKRNKRRDGQ